MSDDVIQQLIDRADEHDGFKGLGCAKGEEFGYFTFGGSDIVVLFQERAQVELIRETNYHHYGTVIARCTPWSA